MKREEKMEETEGSDERGEPVEEWIRRRTGREKKREGINGTKERRRAQGRDRA